MSGWSRSLSVLVILVCLVVQSSFFRATSTDATVFFFGVPRGLMPLFGGASAFGAMAARRRSKRAMASCGRRGLKGFFFIGFAPQSRLSADAMCFNCSTLSKGIIF